KVLDSSDPRLAPEAAFRLAGTEYRAARYAKARDLYDRILLDFSSSTFVRDSLFFLAESELALGDTESSARHLTTLITVYPDSTYREASYYRLADIAYRKRDMAVAVKQLDALGKLFPNGSYKGSAERMRGDVFFDQKQWETAAAEYGKAIQDLPAGSEQQAAWYSLALADLMMDRKTRATEAFAKAGDGASKDLGEKAMYQRSALLAGLGRDSDAIKSLEDLLGAYPLGAHAEDALKLLASLLDSRMDFTTSYPRWDELVRQYPRSASIPEYVYRRGLARMNLGNPAALDDFQRVVKEFPASPYRDECEYSIGYVYSRNSEYARAIPYFQDVALRAPDTDAGNRSSLAVGVCLFNMGSFDKALASLEYLRSRQPGKDMMAVIELYAGRALYRAERLSEASGRLQRAVQALEALDSDPMHASQAADALYWLGWSLFRTGNISGARDAFVSLSQRYPSDQRSREAVYRAGVCETLNGNDAAAAALFDVLAHAPASQPPDQWLEQALYEKGWAFSRLGRTQDSGDAFLELARRFPSGRLAAQAFFKLAMTAFDAGSYVQARSGFQGVAHDFPKSALAKQALYWSAECTRRSGNPQGALEEYWTSMTAGPDSGVLTATLQGFSQALQAVSDLQIAREFADRAEATKTLDPTAAASLQMDYARMLLPQNASQALDVLENVRRLSPPEPLAGEAVLLTGQALAASSQGQRSLEVFAALSDGRLDEIGARATQERARVLEARGDLKEAMNQYLRIGYLFPSFSDLAAEGMFNATRLALQTGDKESATRIRDGMRSRFPDSAWTARLKELMP
ncbi:MAG TPA: tetratricopeptide repeat protein, partial [Spirochaetia bacterium]|nr:tetratricopeptide repeat protein [Spirochaetia bacterium]